MTKSKKILFILTLVSVSLLLAACGGNAAPEEPAGEPTIDNSLLYTAAAETVQADMTQEALNSPTETPMPTATAELIQPTALPTLAPANGAVAATADPNAARPGLCQSTRRQSPWPSRPKIRLRPPSCSLPPPCLQKRPETKPPGAGQDPDDYTAVFSGTSFEMIWSLYNAGFTTWTTDYSYQYWGGSEDCSLYSPSKVYYLTAPVAPGEKVRIKVPMTAPPRQRHLPANLGSWSTPMVRSFGTPSTSPWKLNSFNFYSESSTTLKFQGGCSFYTPCQRGMARSAGGIPQVSILLSNRLEY